MTPPRETDRYEAKAREVVMQGDGDLGRLVRRVAAALRAVEAETLERAAQALDSHRYINASKIVRALASPAAAPAAEKVTPELLAAHAADLAAGRHDLNGAYGCSICGTSPSEPAAPNPASAREMYWYEKAQEAWQARDSAVAVNEADLKDLAATKDRADAAEKRIAELERVIDLSYPFVAEGDENTTVDGLTQEQIVRHINKVMLAASAATGKGEGK